MHVHGKPAVTGALVLGIGNLSRRDQGAGIYAMRYLRDHYDLADTAYVDVGMADADLAADVAEADCLVLLNAAQVGADPGTVRVFEAAEVDEFLRSGGDVETDTRIAKMIDTVRRRGKLRDHYALIGIQPGELAHGDAPSEIVRRSMPRAAGNAAALIHKWRRPVPGTVAP